MLYHSGKAQVLRVVFVQLTNAISWEDAGNKFPEFASEQLLKIIHLDLKKSIPKSFSAESQEAKKVSEHTVVR